MSMFCRIALLLFGVAVMCGCERRAETPAEAIFAQDDCEYVVAVLVDLSPSFAPKMAEDGQAYEFLLGVMEKVFPRQDRHQRQSAPSSPPDQRRAEPGACYGKEHAAGAA